MKIYFLIILSFCFISNTPRANDKLENGPLDIKWKDSIEHVQSVYPDGLTWPSTNSPSTITYSVFKNSKTYWSGIPIQEVRFSFKPDGKLHTVFFQFKYSDAEAIKQRSKEIFGVNYKIKEDGNMLTLSWKNPRNSKIQLDVNSQSPSEWVILGAQEIEQ
jgi:hypothetical protein